MDFKNAKDVYIQLDKAIIENGIDLVKIVQGIIIFYIYFYHILAIIILKNYFFIMYYYVYSSFFTNFKIIWNSFFIICY